MIIFSRKNLGCWVPPFSETSIWRWGIFLCAMFGVYQGSGARTRNWRNWRNTSNSNWGSFAFAFCGVIYVILLNFSKQHWNEQKSPSSMSLLMNEHHISWHKDFYIFYSIKLILANKHASGLKKTLPRLWVGDLPVILMTGQPFPWVVSLKKKAGYETLISGGEGYVTGRGVGWLVMTQGRGIGLSPRPLPLFLRDPMDGSDPPWSNFGDLGPYKSYEK